MKAHLPLLCFGLILSAFASAQQSPEPDPSSTVKLTAAEKVSFAKLEDQGIEVRIKDIARFRGVRGNQLTGFGLVIGLEGTGDSSSSPTKNLIANQFNELGIKVDTATITSKNVALVMVTAELPPFAKTGTTVDVTVSSMGDAKSLQGGILLQTPLFAAGSKDKAYVVAEGPLSIGGFNVSSGGNSVQKNHVNVGRIPGGGIVEATAQTKLVFNGNEFFLELYQEDLTTAERVARKIQEVYPAMRPVANDGATIELQLPDGMTIVEAMSKVEHVKVFADEEAKVVINERTGTIVIGGNVRLGPAAIAHGSLSVRVESTPFVSQPAPFSKTGTTVSGDVKDVGADQESSKIAVVRPNTTVADLAQILQILKLKPTDIISILQALRQQGALKARIELQ